MSDSISLYAKGIMGEQAASHYCEKIGMEVVERRFRAGKGEIDLILLSDQCLIFAEVKTREKASAETAAFAVTKAKQHRMIDAAGCFLAKHPEYDGFTYRFDVLTVTKEGIHHYPNAFEP